MAKIFSRLEHFFQDYVERPVMRLFGGRLEPSDIAKHLSRQMEDERTVFSGKLVGPNYYEVQLSPEDAAQFAPYQQALIDDLADYLVDLGQRRGITLMGRPQIELMPIEGLKRGDLVVTAQLVDRSDNGRTRQFTQQMEPLSVAPADTAEPSAWLELPDRTVALSQPFLTLGRSIDNDVILEGDDVSRYHAEIKRRGSHYVLSDKSSANGTRVNNERISECILRDGDKLCFAATCVTFRMPTRSDPWKKRRR
ncbi:MAG: FHA domain-containing protein [Anaerolineales bacterium]|nr:FHA domain-containing protein [Anaerolineales bacterium]MCB9129135.1 DUF3662 domain-containing protein [Ardenticatenales bacterium]MCB9171629.1 DUF3662 domain-containing protein [Ardenticatenales bacterium]